MALKYPDYPTECLFWLEDLISIYSRLQPACPVIIFKIIKKLERIIYFYKKRPHRQNQKGEFQKKKKP